MLAAVIICSSCTKKDEPAPSAIDHELTEARLIGQWEAVDLKCNRLNAFDNVVSNYEIIKNKGFYENAAGPRTRPWAAPTDESMIYFYADFSYRHVKSNGEPGCYVLGPVLESQGQWSFPDQYTIKLNSVYVLDSTIN